MAKSAVGCDRVVAIRQQGQVFPNAVHLVPVSAAEHEQVFLLFQFSPSPFHVVGNVDKYREVWVVFVTEIFHGVFKVVFVKVLKA